VVAAEIPSCMLNINTPKLSWRNTVKEKLHSNQLYGKYVWMNVTVRPLEGFKTPNEVDEPEIPCTARSHNKLWNKFL
jgi:hypothetical protein